MQIVLPYYLTQTTQILEPGGGACPSPSPCKYENALALCGAGAVRPDPKMVEAGPYTRKPRHPTVNGVGEHKLAVRRRPSPTDGPNDFSSLARLSVGVVFFVKGTRARFEVEAPTFILLKVAKAWELRDHQSRIHTTESLPSTPPSVFGSASYLVL